MRGGRREGAGRKKRDVPLRKVTVSIEPELADKLKAISKREGKSQAALISDWIMKG